MTLQPIERLAGNAPITAVLRGWDAIDPESGAFLWQSGGRSRSGRAPRWGLILPSQSVTERGGLFAAYAWDEHERKFFRAWTLSEAITIGNERLVKMLRRREEGR